MKLLIFVCFLFVFFANGGIIVRDTDDMLCVKKTSSNSNITNSCDFGCDECESTCRTRGFGWLCCDGDACCCYKHYVVNCSVNPSCKMNYCGTQKQYTQKQYTQKKISSPIIINKPSVIENKHLVTENIDNDDVMCVKQMIYSNITMSTSSDATCQYGCDRCSDKCGSRGFDTYCCYGQYCCCYKGHPPTCSVATSCPTNYCR